MIAFFKSIHQCAIMGDELKTRFGYALSGPSASVSSPAYDYKSLFGRRVKIVYEDQNDVFESLLARFGIVRKQIALQDWGTDWLVIDLDDALNYEGKKISEVLVRSRWADCPIGSEFKPVFLLLNHKNAFAKRTEWASHHFYWACWAEVDVELSASAISTPE